MKCDRDFELVSRLPFDYPSTAQKVQFVSPGFQGSGQSTVVFSSIIMDLDQKVLVSAQVTLGLFLGVLDDQVAWVLD
jgi:hypothetical protein